MSLVSLIIAAACPAGGRRERRRLGWMHSLLAGGVALLFATAISGCSSTDKSGSTGFASAVISNRSVGEIQTTAMAVFQDAGYQVMRKPDGTMQFEKEASGTAQLAYSNLGGTHWGEKVHVRVRAEIADLGAGSHRLQCKAWYVRYAGDSFFEEEQGMSNFKRGPYQKLLDEVANRLK